MSVKYVKNTTTGPNIWEATLFTFKLILPIMSDTVTSHTPQFWFLNSNTHNQLLNITLVMSDKKVTSLPPQVDYFLGVDRDTHTQSNVTYNSG